MCNPTHDQLRQLRRKFDGSDPIMRGMSTAAAHSASNAARLARIYDTDPWAFDNEQVRLVLVRAFPNQNTNKTQRERARLWISIINIYFRMRLPAYRIGAELYAKRVRKKFENPKHPPKLTLEREEKRVEDAIRRMRRVAKGLRTTGKPRTGTIGRPPKIKKSDRQTPDLVTA